MNFKLFLLLQKNKVCILHRNAQETYFLISNVISVTKGVQNTYWSLYQYIVLDPLDDPL